MPVGVSGEQLTLAVSLEPVGGSPTGKPTGPVLTSGPAIKAV
jgi:anti-sigma-K factor RskA